MYRGGRISPSPAAIPTIGASVAAVAGQRPPPIPGLVAVILSHARPEVVSGGLPGSGTLPAKVLMGRVTMLCVVRCAVPDIPSYGHGGIRRSTSRKGFVLQTEDSGRCPDGSQSATSADAHGFAVVGLDRTSVDRGWSVAAYGSSSPQSARVDSRLPGDMSSGSRSRSSSRCRWLLNIASVLFLRWCRRRNVVAAGSSLKTGFSPPLVSPGTHR